MAKRRKFKGLFKKVAVCVIYGIDGQGRVQSTVYDV
jgi:hypothetical protein